MFAHDIFRASDKRCDMRPEAVDAILLRESSGRASNAVSRGVTTICALLALVVVTSTIYGTYRFFSPIPFRMFRRRYWAQRSMLDGWASLRVGRRAFARMHSSAASSARSAHRLTDQSARCLLTARPTSAMVPATSASTNAATTRSCTPKTPQKIFSQSFITRIIGMSGEIIDQEPSYGSQRAF